MTYTELVTMSKLNPTKISLEKFLHKDSIKLTKELNLID